MTLSRMICGTLFSSSEEASRWAYDVKLNPDGSKARLKK